MVYLTHLKIHCKKNANMASDKGILALMVAVEFFFSNQQDDN